VAWGLGGDAGGRGVGELAGPLTEYPFPGRPRYLIERVHPLREVVKVLAVAIPLEPVVDGLVRSALGERLADAQPAASGVEFSQVVGESTDPPGAAVIVAMPAQHVMHPVDQVARPLPVAGVSPRGREAAGNAN